MPRSATGFDKFFDEQMRDPKVRESYEKVRREIDSVDQLIRVIDEARADAGMTKAALARKISVEPAALRRLMSANAPNPTFSTVSKLAEAVGWSIQLVPKRKTTAA